MNKYDSDFISEVQTVFEQQTDVPAVSIALIRNNNIALAEAFGYQDPQAKVPATNETMFQAGSISKSIAAILALQLQEENKLNLYSDVNQYLTSWKLTADAGIANNVATTAQLLSMTGGINVDRYDGYIRGSKPPTLLDSLNGTFPATTPKVKISITPGKEYYYSGGGYTVLEQMINDITKQPFAEFANQKLFIPLGMKHTTYKIPLPEKYLKDAAVGVVQGCIIPHDWRNYPEAAAAGMWTTATDLARFCIGIISAFSRHKNIVVLKKSTVEEILIRQPNSYYGLGFYLEGYNREMNFSKGGATVGYRSMMLVYPCLGDGIIIMTNADSGVKLIRKIIDLAVQYYHWPQYYSLDPLS